MVSSNSEVPQLSIAVVTLFPELFTNFLDISFVGRAIQNGLISVAMVPLREHGLGKHLSVDDTPYGGGSGMVIRVDCLMSAVNEAERHLGGRSHRVLLTPQGSPHNSSLARSLAQNTRLTLLCGRYEGFDERIRNFMDREISLGDFVLTGGEVAAMAIIESSIRFCPGVLGNDESILEESFSPELGGGLEYPQYTRPAEYEGLVVPDVLKSGDHQKIAAWRREQSAHRTLVRRPDLVAVGDGAGADPLGSQLPSPIAEGSDR